jgi:hypothetical protein
MEKSIWFLTLGLMVVSAGCHTDIVCTKYLNDLEHRCIYIEPIESENPYVGQVLRDVLEKEFVRQNADLCDANNATILVGGSAFMTLRATAVDSGLGQPKNIGTNQTIESVSVIAKNREGKILLSASYDNKEQYTASKLAKELGSELVKRLK